jgi:hypothetical protein
MMSSDWQLEQTGVDRTIARLTIRTGLAGSWFRWNGLRSDAWFISCPPVSRSPTRRKDNPMMTSASSSLFSWLWTVSPRTGWLSGQKPRRITAPARCGTARDPRCRCLPGTGRAGPTAGSSRCKNPLPGRDRAAGFRGSGGSPSRRPRRCRLAGFPAPTPCRRVPPTSPACRWHSGRARSPAFPRSRAASRTDLCRRLLFFDYARVDPGRYEFAGPPIAVANERYMVAGSSEGGVQLFAGLFPHR